MSLVLTGMKLTHRDAVVCDCACICLYKVSETNIGRLLGGLAVLSPSFARMLAGSAQEKIIDTTFPRAIALKAFG